LLFTWRGKKGKFPEKGKRGSVETLFLKKQKPHHLKERKQRNKKPADLLERTPTRGGISFTMRGEADS